MRARLVTYWILATGWLVFGLCVCLKLLSRGFNEAVFRDFVLPAALALLALSMVPMVGKWQELKQRRRIGLCLSCGYSLTGNVSGVCPECGHKVG